MNISSIIKTGSEVFNEAKKSGLFEMVLGTYSDGTVRSIPDAIRGEDFSPKQKRKAMKKRKKRKSIRITDIL